MRLDGHQVIATYQGETVYVSTETDLNWRKVLVPTFDPVVMSKRAAERVADLAARDESFSNVRVEEHRS